MKKIIKLVVSLFVVFMAQQCFAEYVDAMEYINSFQTGQTEKNAIAEYSKIKAGDRFFALQLGSIVPQNKVDMYGYSLSWGKVGLGLGAKYLYFVADQFAIGAEIEHNMFSQATNYNTLVIKSSATNYMLALRLNIADEESMRLYIPFGLGIASKKAKLSYSYMNETASHTDFAYNIGIGIEQEIENGNALGLELKYNCLKWDEEDFDQDFQYIEVKLIFSFKV